MSKGEADDGPRTRDLGTERKHELEAGYPSMRRRQQGDLLSPLSGSRCGYPPHCAKDLISSPKSRHGRRTRPYSWAERETGDLRLVGVLIGCGLNLLGLVVYCQDYVGWGIERYYGSVSELGTTRRHATWDTPEWVTQGFLATTALLGLTFLVAAVAATAIGVLREAPRGRASQ